MPIARLMHPVAIFTSMSAPVANGATAAAMAARPTIQPKNVRGLGALSSSTCISPVAISAPAAARSAYRHVFEFTSAALDFGTSTCVWNAPRAMSRPTTATPADTSAAAAPPAHSRPASTVTAGREGAAEGGVCHSGGVCSAHGDTSSPRLILSAGRRPAASGDRTTLCRSQSEGWTSA